MLTREHVLACPCDWCRHLAAGHTVTEQTIGLTNACCGVKWALDLISYRGGMGFDWGCFTDFGEVANPLFDKTDFPRLRLVGAPKVSVAWPPKPNGAHKPLRCSLEPLGCKHPAPTWPPSASL